MLLQSDTTIPYLITIGNYFEMNITTTNVLIFAMLIGGIAHLMIYQNGYWNDMMWMTSIMSVGIPAILYRNAKNPKRNRRRVEKILDI